MTQDTNTASGAAEQAAYDLGAKGAPPTESERLLFEAWMRGHCWALCATWDGKGYRSDAEQGGFIDPRAMNTRQLWAAWRDRAALASAAAPADTTALDAAMRAIQQAIELIGEPENERIRTVRRVLRGAVVVAEDSGEDDAPQPDTAYAALPEPLEIKWPELHSSALDCGKAPAHNIVSLSPLPSPAHNERVYGGHGNEIVYSYYTEHQMREYARQEVYRAEEAWQARASRGQVPAGAGESAYDPCGGCGEDDPKKRCLGCMHPFTPASQADSMLEGAVLLKEARDALWQPANVALCERIDAYLEAARKKGENHD